MATFWYEIKSTKPYRQFEGTALDKETVIRRLTNLISELPRDACANTTIEIISLETGELLFDAASVEKDTITKIAMALNHY